MNLQNGDDWHEMCATTPGRVQGRNFDGPTSCASWVSFFLRTNNNNIFDFTRMLFFFSEEWHQCDMVGRGWKLPLANSFFFVFFESLMFFELNQL